MPQIYKNYQLKSTSGLSIFFLVVWLFGDAGNLLGALFTRQASWQVVVAGYYVCVDVTLVFQFFWYTHYKRSRNGYGELAQSHHDGDTGSVLDGVSPSDDNSSYSAPSLETAQRSEAKDVGDFKGTPPSNVNGHSPVYQNEKAGSSRRSITRTGNGSSLPIASTRTILLASMLCAMMANATPTEAHAQPMASHQSTVEIAGRIVSWMSTILYLLSRPPQLYKNYCRKSTSGLSPLLFMAAFSGNLFYSSSILTNPNCWYDFAPYGGGGWADADGNDRLEWIGRTIPFFLGAFCVLGMDAFMGVQFLMYGSQEEAVVRVDDPVRGRGQWTRVRGWMRGWIPSVSPERKAAATEEGQALLNEERGRYGTV
ncbi:hypothetical protein MW887_008633 [Aspergillus wentii]|nr:hypothetical protein MW887_008633 [Aspergillus wentii]